MTEPPAIASADEGAASAEPPFSIRRLALSAFLCAGYGSLAIHLSALPGYLRVFVSLPPFIFGYSVGLLLWLTILIVGTPLLYRRMTRHGAGRAVFAAEALVFVALPLLGIFYDWVVGESCLETDCDGFSVHRAFALPELLHVAVLHGLTVFAYAVSRRRPGALPARAEVVVLAVMGAGCVLQLALAVQLGAWLVLGLVGAPLLFCAASPLFALLLFFREIRARMLRHARRARVVAPMTGGAAGLLGLYGLVEAALKEHNEAALDVFTQTCGYTFSQLPIRHESCLGHYLCTVAACGHPKLVKPLRLGLRGGEPIVVNRQLAMANAFEDLLHERCPRVGRAARRAYDRVGLPLSRWIQNRVLADAVYLLMKPAELCFYLFLLLFDPRDPEERLERMYRAPLP